MTDGTKGTQVQKGSTGPDIDRDRWHHVALTVSDGGLATLWLDYLAVVSVQINDYDGMCHTSQYSFQFSVGADVYRGHWGFLGKSGDIRVSDWELSYLEFLRPVPPGPVDADTLVCLTSRLSDFGQTNFAALTWPYQYAFNGACRAEFSPRWGYRVDMATANQYPTADVPGSNLRGELHDERHRKRQGQRRLQRMHRHECRGRPVASLCRCAFPEGEGRQAGLGGQAVLGL